MKDYKKILEGVVNIINTTEKSDIISNLYTYLDENCPEFIESEDERIRKVLIGWINLEPSTSFNDTFDGFSKEQILSFLDTLELKEPVLDEAKIGETQIYIEDDGGEPPYDGKQWLDLGCLEYEIPKDKFRDGDDVEIIIRKIRK